jgi:hypothetical protein
MKFQNMIRVSMMLAGLAAGVLLAKPVYAQQEVDPDHFEATSDSTSQNVTAAQVAQSIDVAPATSADPAAPLAAQQMVVGELTATGSAVTAVLMFGVASIILLLGIAEAVRGSRRRTWKAQTGGGFPAGATAN